MGFGGPCAPEEVKPFLLEVTRGRKIPEARLSAVAHHYEAIGGFSPYNQYTLQLVQKVRESLEARGIALPVFTGMRNWHPFLKETLTEIKEHKLQKGLAIILAPHRSETSCKRYQDNVEDAKQFVSANELEYEFLDPWSTHPLFIEAQADQVRKLPVKLEEAKLIFTAHSIPEKMRTLCNKCDYVKEYETTSRLVANSLRVKDFICTYQSRSGNPHEPWLGPDIGDVLKEQAGLGIPKVVLVPVGFLCDNAEVLYDLDIEAQGICRSKQIDYFRASTVMDHPRFVEMVTEKIQEQFT